VRGRGEETKRSDRKNLDEHGTRKKNRAREKNDALCPKKKGGKKRKQEKHDLLQS